MLKASGCILTIFSTLHWSLFLQVEPSDDTDGSIESDILDKSHDIIDDAVKQVIHLTDGFLNNFIADMTQNSFRSFELVFAITVIYKVVIRVCHTCTTKVAKIVLYGIISCIFIYHCLLFL